ncbi:MAG: glycine--tRNA ligase [Candidatus Magasanikbacteria bacterium CG_4_10_14_0_8_um_filter_32_14]|uniref:Glycine--tRNA ligase n=2 Tax=Candidatus Magasanikiibacteriota TaxID=1752731 RepID=A0A2M7R914_9BACT|nr:MAG: glycine--tRNA ligase [Candidatus Magasanikbacteria bacterium CG1_02_32_51]PIY93245.1 MAG: glycine--tRNA ligase [Candidatus Magasanikbacteria bacterium CG_4_10_14_0_8_um_filter_32_14]
MKSLESIVNFAKQKGFIFQSSEIYEGLSAVYDFGPLGILLKNNLQALWWKEMVQRHNNIYGLDAAILMHSKVWEASGHVASFSDPLVDCKECKMRHRADQLLENVGVQADEKMGVEILNKLLQENHVVCSNCQGELTSARDFNLMLETYLSKTDDSSKVYLRPETAQGIYVNFKNVQASTRAKVPFGIAQVGKAFRNEITTKQFIFRTKEFSQMEMQYFVKPENSEKIYEDWKTLRLNWWQSLGLKAENLRYHEHEKLAHYAKAAYDIEYQFPWGWKEIEGLHNRGNFDLTQHEKFSGKNLKYRDPETNEEYVPYIIEASSGLDRNVFTLLVDAYEELDARSGEEDAKHEKEIVLRLHKSLAPIKMAILPLSKKEPLQNMSNEIQNTLSKNYMTQYDETGSIGKRYRRQDEIGTPYCITIDFESLEDKKVTVRDRDTMAQDRIAIEDLEKYFVERF